MRPVAENLFISHYKRQLDLQRTSGTVRGGCPEGFEHPNAFVSHTAIKNFLIIGSLPVSNWLPPLCGHQACAETTHTGSFACRIGVLIPSVKIGAA